MVRSDREGRDALRRGGVSKLGTSSKVVVEGRLTRLVAASVRSCRARVAAETKPSPVRRGWAALYLLVVVVVVVVVAAGVAVSFPGCRVKVALAALVLCRFPGSAVGFFAGGCC